MADEEIGYEPSEVARLIEQRRKQRGLSVRAAAASAGLSEGRWRQIAKGYQQAAAGVRVPVNAPDETLRRMSVAAGVMADELDAIGEYEIAEMIRAEGASRLRHPSRSIPNEGLPPSSLTLVPDDMLAAEVARRLMERARLAKQATDMYAERLREKEVGHDGDAAPMNDAEETPATGNVRPFRRADERDDETGTTVPVQERAVANEDDTLEDEGIAQLEDP